MTVKTDDNFWDCECRADFIHPKSQKTCGKCGAREKNQPDSRVNEIAIILGRALPKEILLNLLEFTNFARKMGFEGRILEAFDLSDEAWAKTRKTLKGATQ